MLNVAVIGSAEARRGVAVNAITVTNGTQRAVTRTNTSKWRPDMHLARRYSPGVITASSVSEGAGSWATRFETSGHLSRWIRLEPATARHVRGILGRVP